MILRRALGAIAALILFAATQAHAQSNPGWVTGFVPTAAQWNAEWASKQDCCNAGSGTVTSVALLMPSMFSVIGSPVTTGGTLSVAFVPQAANCIVAGPVSGGNAAPTCRALVAADGAALVAVANVFTAQNTFTSTVIARRTVASNTVLSATTDNVVCANVSGGAFTITMPPGTGTTIPNGLPLSVDDCMNDSATNNLTVAANSGQTIGGATSLVIKTNGGAINGVWNSTQNDWNLF